MTSPYGPSGGNDPQQQWGQQPYGGYTGTPAGGTPEQGYPQTGGYPQQGYPQTGAYPQQGYPQQGGYPQQTYGGQGGYGYPQGGPPPQKSALPWVITGIVVVLLGALAVLGFVWPGFFNTRVFDENAVEEAVTRIVREDYGASEVSDVTCPAGRPLEAGTSFDCTATVDGEQSTITISVQTDEGEYQVGQP
ncbi:DUF4333 domain-containing protein [Actinoalloteichus hymeniacidonis]|uniref:DUF4333 family protein n=1 Tax=Actinoalloteichus hymeniacidonis TaxID=340345 RepID=A0AAC9MXH4_9PSEU|nr:DUF4333 domain-containing protein [Actinoalloteichus hymeniacidonis]AOS63238.1 putative DUF4333 family protein [Actinoalloteichus hymeniacidonis]MBB5908723.1 hypothetical protein [Actinoalloteichus hymeniacidonis]